MFARKKSIQSIVGTAAAMATLAFLSGCGNPYGYSSGKKLASTTTATDTTPTPTVSPDPVATPAPSPVGVPPYSMAIRGVGYTTTTVTVSANNVLRIRFTPGVQDTPVSGTGYYPQYSKMGVYLQVGSAIRPTEMLSNGYTDAQQQGSIMDFTSSIARQTCTRGDTTCRETVTITVSKPNNDYWCLNFGTSCNWAQMYSTHPWNGTLTIQTDDTDSL